MLTIHLSPSSLLQQFSLSPPLDRWRARKKTFLVVSTEVYIVALSLEVAFSAGVTTFPTGPHRPTQKYFPDIFPDMRAVVGVEMKADEGTFRGFVWQQPAATRYCQFCRMSRFTFITAYILGEVFIFQFWGGWVQQIDLLCFCLCLCIKDIFGRCVF